MQKTERPWPAFDAGVPLGDAQIVARHADPRTTKHNDRARGNLDHHGLQFLTAYLADVQPASIPPSTTWPHAAQARVRPSIGVLRGR